MYYVFRIVLKLEISMKFSREHFRYRKYNMLGEITKCKKLNSKRAKLTFSYGW